MNMWNETVEAEEVIDPWVRKRDDHLVLAEQIVKGWSGSFLDVALRRTDLPSLVHQVVLANCVRQLQSLRSVVAVCNGGDSVSGSFLVRSMFETAVNVGFIMKPNWTHTVRAKKEKLSQEFRAQLFVIHCQLELEDRQTRAKDKANKKSNAKLVFDLCTDSIEVVKKEVGAKWCKTLASDPFTVTGQSYLEIAGLVSPELAAWYTVVEGENSMNNHAVGSSHFVQKSMDGVNVSKWESSPESLYVVLHNAIYLTVTTLGFVDQGADIGIGGRSMLSGLRAKLNAIG